MARLTPLYIFSLLLVSFVFLPHVVQADTKLPPLEITVAQLSGTVEV
jgi:hypothetical protein